MAIWLCLELFSGTEDKQHVPESYARRRQRIAVERFGPGILLNHTVQLRTKLGGAGFKGVRVTRPAGGLFGTWKIEMRSDISSVSSRKIVAEMRQIASALGFELDRKTVKTKIVGTRIIVSFTALT